MSLSENHDVDLLTAVLSLADPDDDRHVRRIQALGERLSTYMESREHHVSDELSAMSEDLLTIMRTMAALGQRVHELEAWRVEPQTSIATLDQPAQLQISVGQSDTIDILNQHIQSLSRTVTDQAERIQGLSATVVELMDRIQAMEDRPD